VAYLRTTPPSLTAVYLPLVMPGAPMQAHYRYPREANP
jgi:hypothetical protein